MSHRENDAQRELQHEQDLEEQWDRIRILQNRIFFLDSLPWNIGASRGAQFVLDLYNWRQELRESIKSLEED